jgi:hypothetical protein
VESSPAVRCHHIRANGIRCGSLALRDHRYCYYHQRCRPQLVNFSSPAYEPVLMALPLFEDAHGIQSTLHSVVFNLLDRKIGVKTAGLILYALQIASSNLKHMKAEAPDPDKVAVDLPRLSELPPLEKLKEPDRMNSHSQRMTTYPYTPSAKDMFYDDVMRQDREIREHPENLVQETFSVDLPRNLRDATAKLEGDYHMRQEEKAHRERLRKKTAESLGTLDLTSENKPAESKDADNKPSESKPPAGKSSPDNLPPGTIHGCAGSPPRGNPIRRKIQ